MSLHSHVFEASLWNSELIFYFDLWVSLREPLGPLLQEAKRTKRTSWGQAVGRSWWQIKSCFSILAAWLKKCQSPEWIFDFYSGDCSLSGYVNRFFSVIICEHPKADCGRKPCRPLWTLWLSPSTLPFLSLGPPPSSFSAPLPHLHQCPVSFTRHRPSAPWGLEQGLVNLPWKGPHGN